MSLSLGHNDFVHLACLLEATARKPGNVHRCRDFDDSSYLDFLLSAAVLARHLHPKIVEQLGVGEVILRAVQDTKDLVGHNTNLGMILLLTPLAAVQDRRKLRGGLGHVLDQLSIPDAVSVYRAIRIASPGGLGSATDQDVASEPSVTLREAMRLAADRDAIARQYTTGYADVFDIALPTLRDSLNAGKPLETAIVSTQLTLMAGRPDTLIARKRGPGMAAESARRAFEVLRNGWPDEPGSVSAIRAFDAWLREDGHARNPGATADLVAATLYAALCDETIQVPHHLSKPGWDAGDAL